MAKTQRKMVVFGQIVATVLLSAPAETSDVPAALVLKLTVDNRCGIPDSVLGSAQRTTGAVYARIGVHVVWSSPVPDDWSAGPGTLPLRVVLLSEGREHSLLAELGLPRNALNDVLGVAPTLTRTAYIFCRRVALRTKKSAMKRLDVALGRAIAHEVGHLVLPGHGHSEIGIMRGSLDLFSEKTAGFSDEQGASIRALLRAVGSSRVPIIEGMDEQSSSCCTN